MGRTGARSNRLHNRRRPRALTFDASADQRQFTNAVHHWIHDAPSRTGLGERGETMKRPGKHFLFADAAATTIEYGLLAAMIALAVSAGGYLTGSNLQTAFKEVTDNMATGSIKKAGGAVESGYELRSGSPSDDN